MTPDQMRTQSAKKVKQVMELMKVLHLDAQARQRVTPDGFLENIVFWVDAEKYPIAETKEPAKEDAPEVPEKSPDHA